MLIQRETPGQEAAIHAVVSAAFAAPDKPVPVPEAVLVDELRAGDAWLPRLSLVALRDGVVIGHVVCSRARVGAAPALGLGPLGVHPEHQRSGVGSALMHAVLAAADALGEPLVVLLGSPDYYRRFGFRLADELGITAPPPDWRPYLQARTLHTYTPDLRGRFTYAAPFDRF